MSLTFAIGSNLAPSQMQRRCPGCRIVSRAVLPGYRLAFGGWSKRWGGPVATVVPAPGHSVPGVVYWLSDADLISLDRFEGVPRVYRRFTAQVVARGERVLHAEVYRLEAPPGARPSEAYAAVLRAMYAAWGFDPKPLREAEQGLLWAPLPARRGPARRSKRQAEPGARQSGRAR